MKFYFSWIVYFYYEKLYIDKYVWGDDEMENFNDLKKLYEDGYRCIYQDGSEGNRTIYLKNFDNEKSTVVNLQDENEFSQFQNYISCLRMS